MPWLQEFSAFFFCLSLAALALLLPQKFPKAIWVQRLPPPLWCYGLPMVFKGLGILLAPSAPLQEMISLILPAALFLVLLPTPLSRLWKVGPKALLAMLAGSFGIFAGGPIVLWLFQPLLPSDAWRSLPLLCATWIGGSLNMLAVREALQGPQPLLGPMILVDSVIAYSWFAFLLFLTAHQPALNHWLNAKPLFFKEDVPSSQRRSLSFWGPWFLGGVVIVQTLVCLAMSTLFPPFLGLSQKTWGILLASLLALLLSHTRWAQNETERETYWGQFLLYTVLAALGFQGDIRAFFQTPVFLVVGIVWVAIHAGVLLVAGKLLRLPLGLLATASQANIGGVVSTPLVGAAYDPRFVSIGLLLALLGNVIGTPLGIVCAYLMHHM